MDFLLFQEPGRSGEPYFLGWGGGGGHRVRRRTAPGHAVTREGSNGVGGAKPLCTGH